MLLDHLSKYLESVEDAIGKPHPHHKHLSERVIAVDKPAIVDVIGEAALLAGTASDRSQL